MTETRRLLLSSRLCFLQLAITFAGLQMTSSVRAQAPVFGPPHRLNNNGAYDIGQDFDPRLATDNAGHWVVVWSAASDFSEDFDIRVSRSLDDGITWSTPNALNSNAAVDSSESDDYTPHICTDGSGVWIAAWRTREFSGGTDDDVLFSRSLDNGETWSGLSPLDINAGTDSDGDFRPYLATDGAGNWVAVWESDATMDFDIQIARSSDNGVTWSAPSNLNSNALVDTAVDAGPRVATDQAGNWIAVWSSDDALGGLIGTDSDILFSRSTDNGQTWTAQAALNTNAQTDSGSDIEPQIATDHAGNWIVIWSSADSLGGTIDVDLDILMSHSSDGGVTWSDPAPVNSNAATDAESDLSPELASDSSGLWTAVWNATDPVSGDLDIFVASSMDNGTTWSGLEYISEYAAHDLANDNAPKIATDGIGHWVIVWFSEYAFGEVGLDQDILVSTSPFIAAARRWKRYE